MTKINLVRTRVKEHKRGGKERKYHGISDTKPALKKDCSIEEGNIKSALGPPIKFGHIEKEDLVELA